MKFETVSVSRWPGNINSPVRLLLRAGIGLSFVLTTAFSVPQWSHAVDRRDEKDFRVSCQHVEPKCITSLGVRLIKKCRDCGHIFALELFPPKGGGRRESRCIGCHNAHRRSRSMIRSKNAPMAIKVSAGHFDEKHEGLNDLLDLICSDILRKEVGS